VNFADITVGDLKKRKALPPPSGFAILYARFSPRPGEKDCPSSENQLDSLRAHCSENNLTVRAEYHDDAVSGSTLDRDGLHEAINALQPGDVLLCTMSDRLTRGGAIDTAAVEYLVNQAGATIRFTHEPNSDGSPHAELLRDLMAAVGRHYNAMLKLRTGEGRKAKAKRKGFVGGSAPFGFRIEGEDRKTRRLVPDTEEQETIAMIREFRDGGADWGEVTRMLNRRGRPSRTGQPWNHNQVRKLGARVKTSIYGVVVMESPQEEANDSSHS
jgi:site-specific DNA recombinase